MTAGAIAPTQIAPTQRTGAAVAVLAIAVFAYFGFAIVALHFLRPDYDPRWNFISDYAVGPYGFVMTSAFLALDLGILLLLIGLVRIGPRSVVSRIGLCVFAILVPGTLIAAVFNADVSPPATTHGQDPFL